MKNVLMVVCILGLLSALLGAVLLGIRWANVLLGEQRGNVKSYLTLPIVILVVGFIVFSVTFFIVVPN